MAIQRLFVTKRESFNQEAQRMLHTLQQELSMPVTGVTIYERYDIENLDAKDLEAAKNLIFSEPPVDTVLEKIPNVQGFVFAVEYVPGQYDQRADSAEQVYFHAHTYIWPRRSMCSRICYRRHFHKRTRKCHQSILH